MSRVPRLIGVVHLAPLPGAPRARASLGDVEAAAVADARALVEGGADAAILENFGDAPFAADEVGPDVVAAMTRIALAIRAAAPGLPLGVNVLRNDALAALAVAVAADASFIRVNVLSGAMVTDQGLVTGRARALLLERRRLGAERIGIWADVHVKHAVPLGASSLADAARDTWERAGADALIVTGTGTGRRFDPADLDTVRAAVPDAPLLVGSGLDPDGARAWGDRFDGAIVGTYLHAAGDLARPLDAARVTAIGHALRAHAAAANSGS